VPHPALSHHPRLLRKPRRHVVGRPLMIQAHTPPLTPIISTVESQRHTLHGYTSAQAATTRIGFNGLSTQHDIRSARGLPSAPIPGSMGSNKNSSASQHIVGRLRGACPCVQRLELNPGLIAPRQRELVMVRISSKCSTSQCISAQHLSSEQ
jgi:hypothetical protein